MKLPHWFMQKLGRALNAFLHLDEESKNRLQALSGKVIGVELLPFHFTFQCIFDADGVRLESDLPLPTHAHVTGTPLQMMGMMLAKEDRQRFFAEDITITGDAELGQQMVNLFDELEIDWEEILSQFVGDVPAYHFSRAVKWIKDQVKEKTDVLSQDVNEYVHEEAEWFPNKEALESFYTEIDDLRMDVDRIEARIHRILHTNDEELP